MDNRAYPRQSLLLAAQFTINNCLPKDCIIRDYCSGGVFLTFEKEAVSGGIPRIAPPELAQKILERMQRLSQDFGTTIDIEGNVGVIRVQ